MTKKQHPDRNKKTTTHNPRDLHSPSPKARISSVFWQLFLFNWSRSSRHAKHQLIHPRKKSPQNMNLQTYNNRTWRWADTRFKSTLNMKLVIWGQSLDSCGNKRGKQFPFLYHPYSSEQKYRSTENWQQQKKI